MRTLVVFYSLTGNTKGVAEQIAAACNADMEQIEAVKLRSGALMILRFACEVMFKRKGLIQPAEKDPAQYDLVVLGTPIWAWTMASPVRTYIKQHSLKFNRVAFFCTEGGAGGERAFAHMSDLIGKQPAATLEITEPDLKNGADKDKLKAFFDALAQHSDRADAPLTQT